MDIRKDIDRMMADWDRADSRNGPFHCRYQEEYVDDLDIQAVTRSIVVARHVAAHFQLRVGAELREIVTVDQRRLGPFTIQTFQPNDDGVTVLMELGTEVSS